MKEAQSGRARGSKGSISQLHYFAIETLQDSWDFINLFLLEEIANVLFKRTSAENITQNWIATLEELGKFKQKVLRSPNRNH